jgi:hypothetical protein
MSFKLRVPMVDPETATGEIAHFFTGSTTFRGRVANSARMWGHVPYIAKFHLLASITPAREGAGEVLPCRIKELAVLMTSHVNGCNY